MNEFQSRKDYYESYLRDTAGIDLTSKTDQEVLSLLQKNRREQYDKLTDSVYKAKGYDKNSIPLDETLQRLGMNQEEYTEIIVEARNRKVF